MTVQEVINLDKAVIDAWNKHDTEKFLSLCDESIVWKDPASPEPYKGKKGAGEFFNMWLTAFPDMKITVLQTIANETGVASEIEFSGTNKGPLRMPGQPEIPATNRKVTHNMGCYFAKVKNGKVTSVSTFPDTMGMMAQLGLMQEQHA